MQIYYQIIDHLKTKGEVLTEHVGDSKLSSYGENDNSDQFIHDRDVEWMLQSDCIVAEVTAPSLGVGYEIGRAVENGKNVLCLYRAQEGKRLSAMISGCSDLEVCVYENIDDAKLAVDKFFEKQ